MSTLTQNTVILKNTKQKIQLFNCTYCHINVDDIWTNKSKTILCCRSCWGNDPIVARAMNGIKFRSNKQLK